MSNPDDARQLEDPHKDDLRNAYPNPDPLLYSVDQQLTDSDQALEKVLEEERVR